MSIRLYLWTRDLHGYLGLWVSPFVVLFSISVILLNHPWIPLGGSANITKATATVEIPPGLEHSQGIERVGQIRKIMQQAGVRGEVGHSRNHGRSLTAVVWQPGREITLEVNLDSHVLAIEQRNTGLGDAMNYLHKSPGPHLTAIRGNWIYTQVWRWLADAVVYLVLFITVSGIYLWAVMRAERRIGLILLGAGAACFMGVLYALTV